MRLGVDPKVDFAFKRVFGSEGNADILIDLIHSVLKPGPDEEIISVEIMNPFTLKETEDDKLSILDIRARDQRGRQFNIEMQMIPWTSLPQRLLYYWSKLYQEQLRQGADYRELRPTISICFLDAVLYPNIADYHLRFRLWDDQHGVVLTEDIEIHLIQLQKFHRELEDVADPLERWLYFLRYAEELDPEHLPEPLRRPPIEHAAEELSMITKRDLERERYEARLKAQRDLRSMQIDFRAEGVAEGLERGEAQGLRQGIEKGELVGRILSCQELLAERPAPVRDLQEKSTEELKKMAEELKRRLIERS